MSCNEKYKGFDILEYKDLNQFLKELDKELWDLDIYISNKDKEIQFIYYGYSVNICLIEEYFNKRYNKENREISFKDLLIEVAGKEKAEYLLNNYFLPIFSQVSIEGQKRMIDKLLEKEQQKLEQGKKGQLDLFNND